MHFKRTLASFSLEKRVAVVTGGARGLGLVMSQACMLSGADVAIVDLSSEFVFLLWSLLPGIVIVIMGTELYLRWRSCTTMLTQSFTEDEGQRQADLLMQHFEEENPGSEL